MIVDRSHFPWFIFFVIATAGITLIWAHEFHPGLLGISPSPEDRYLFSSVGGTVIGLAYGGLAFLIFLFSALYGWRRKRPALRVGRVQVWLRAHIWLSLFSIPLILLHADFDLGGPLTTVLMALYAFVMISGFAGLGLQHFLPRVMKERVPTEAIFEQIPHILTELVASAELIQKRVSDHLKPPEPKPKKAEEAEPETVEADPPAPFEPDPAVEEFAEFIQEQSLPYLRMANGRKHKLNDSSISEEAFRILKLQNPVTLHDEVDQLHALVDERRSLDLQTRLQHWLHGWLVVHVPFTVLLLIFTIWHIIVTIFLY